MESLSKDRGSDVGPETPKGMETPPKKQCQGDAGKKNYVSAKRKNLVQ
jgi:hypothetical protein